VKAKRHAVTLQQHAVTGNQGEDCECCGKGVGIQGSKSLLALWGSWVFFCLGGGAGRWKVEGDG